MPRLTYSVSQAATAVIVGSVIIVPFLIVGPEVETLAKSMLESAMSVGVLAFACTVLLAIDALLPIPSSVICLFSYAALEPVTAAAVVATGTFASTLTAYAAGRWLNTMLSSWLVIGKTSTEVPQAEVEFLALTLSRSVPVLAEGLAIRAGMAQVPVLTVALAGALGGLGVAAAYWAVTVGLSQSSPALIMTAILVTLALWLSWKGLTLLRAQGGGQGE